MFIQAYNKYTLPLLWVNKIGFITDKWGYLGCIKVESVRINFNDDPGDLSVLDAIRCRKAKSHAVQCLQKFRIVFRA